MKDMGVDAFRFSISWTRIFPNGSGQINQAGVDHYNKVIDALLANGMKPYVTMFHFDTPQALEDRYKGWLNPQIINDFASYAETLYEKFGDRVKHWITMNEPHTVAVQGYDTGVFAPGRCSILLGSLRCEGGNSATEPYIVAHHLILAHANAVSIYRSKYQKKQQGSIGASFNVMWYEPATNRTKDVEATQRAQDFQLGWFLDPLMFGDYPSSMRERVEDRLPKFSEAERALIKGALDFVGINHYTTYYVSDSPIRLLNDSLGDSHTTAFPFSPHGKPIGEKANAIWLYIVPRGIRELMNYIKDKYGNPTVLITENENITPMRVLRDQHSLILRIKIDLRCMVVGMDDPNDPFKPVSEALKDEKRIRYFSGYLQNLAAAINEDGCNVKGYFAWSLLDNWEWIFGYTSRFGLFYVDYRDNFKRYPKNSVQWFKTFFNSTC
ncbi:hypothetical protein Cgig2_009403 [Carnegiea gigantea]|uniref:Beta-glucosidase n=1 Tax=Carnegiea gigantea TaxID=171969 RepID=A0A9Q1JSQ0_9CARY|nr:hypothetical protein Cgig2_009403 [Carnegiea gigantea]